MKAEGKHFEFKVQTFDGLSLHGQLWNPVVQAKGVVSLVHGLGEHCGRYEHVAEAFAREGFALFAFDLRGHGRSDGPRGHIPDYAALMEDVDALLAESSSSHPGLPHFLYGHSLGGNLAIHYALQHPVGLAGIIASAPLLRLAYDPPAWKTGLLQILRALRINHALNSQLDYTALSRDVNVVRTCRNDPLTHSRISPSLAVDMVQQGRWDLDHAAELPIPLLLMHGDADRITSVDATREFAAQLGERCTLKIWSGLFHELHNEPEKNQVIGFVTDWLGRYS